MLLYKTSRECLPRPTDTDGRKTYAEIEDKDRVIDNTHVGCSYMERIDIGIISV